MIAKSIVWFGNEMILICDGKCNKAWGINERPKNQLSNDIDDYEFLSDIELGDAPIDPLTYEGGQGKPGLKENRLNKWCARECERSNIVRENEDFDFVDYDKRIKNIED